MAKTQIAVFSTKPYDEVYLSKASAEPPIHARDGRRALQIALACIESYESGKRILTP